MFPHTQLGPRVACHAEKIFEIHVLHINLGLLLLAVWHFNCCAWGPAGGVIVCQSKYSREILGIAGGAHF